MVTLSSDSRNIIGRGPPLGAGLFFLGLVSVGIMMLDQRSDYLNTVRQWLGAAASPVYAVVQTPGQAWEWLTGSFADRNRLKTENAELSEQLREARVKLLQFDSLREENVRLRAVREASAGVGGRTMIAEIMRVDVDPFRHRVRINKGSDDGVFRTQPVLDAFGIVGQVVQVDKYSSTIILISDSGHSIPVQVNRNGIRSIAEGAGDLGKLSLPYLTVESDVKTGDLLVSSGLDGIFPAGYPVAKVSKVERNPADTFALVEAKPLAQLDRDREVLLLWAEPPSQVAAPAAKPSKPAATESKPAAETSSAPPAPATPSAAPREPAETLPPGAQPLPQSQPPQD
ncbi:rod shape-determining protein MreC [Peristeroidobacter agariperforans]|uniref:rod shape-determining protein MreC n=1 Tax=Peristeroidobacter agariperforans TaxID=268404 RepID=UPI00101BF0DE|nr:rod shape-determining protein MreC [Peristeroidobacter agariperforans]